MKKEGKKAAVLGKSRNTKLFCFIIAALFFYILFRVYPVIVSFIYGFTNWSGVGDFDFVGFRNFKYLLQDGTLANSMKNTIIYAVFEVAVGNVIAIFFAFLLNMKLHLKGAFRTAFYIPALFSTVVVGFVWNYVFAPNYGMIAEILSRLGSDLELNMLGSPTTALLTVAFVEQWRGCGTMTLIYLAGLQEISEEVLEAAVVDGTNARQRIFRIQLPLLANAITINIMLGLINGLKSFDYVYTMTSGGPGYATNTLMYSIYRIAFIENQYGKAEALAAASFLLILVISLGALFALNKKEVEA